MSPASQNKKPPPTEADGGCLVAILQRLGCLAASHDDADHCDNRGNDCYDQRDDSQRSRRTRGANFTGRTSGARRRVSASSKAIIAVAAITPILFISIAPACGGIPHPAA